MSTIKQELEKKIVNYIQNEADTMGDRERHEIGKAIRKFAGPLYIEAVLEIMRGCDFNGECGNGPPIMIQDKLRMKLKEEGLL